MTYACGALPLCERFRPGPYAPRVPGPAPLVAGVAAGHPATAEAGLAVLADGGSAADAAVAAILASCVAETVMTGLGGGGFAIHWSAAERVATCVDFFVTVPGLAGDRAPAPMTPLPMLFGSAPVEYLIGAPSVGVPGVAAGCGALHERWGRLPWERLCEPALALARTGVPMSAAHAGTLAMVAPVMRLGDGGRAYAPDGELLRGGDLLFHPGLATAIGLLRDEGPAVFTTGTIGRVLVDLLRERGAAIAMSDLEAYQVRFTEPAQVAFAGARVQGRVDLGGLLGTLGRLPEDLGARDEAGQAVAYVTALDGADARGGTTNLCTVDRAGNVCVATTSLGLGSGDWLPGLGVHCNSMLGEVDLVRGELRPGERMNSMMVPLVATRDDVPVLAAGAAGGARIRSALVQVLARVLALGQELQPAVDAWRLHPVAGLVHAEPGMPDTAAAALQAAGYTVERWTARHHYFGGVSALGPRSGAADPRRDGAVRLLDGAG